MWLEKKICSQADIVWWFTEMAMERARNRHPQLAERGHCVIPGANAPAFTNEPYQRGKHLVIAHFGSLSETRNLETFLLALRRVIEKNPQWTDHIRLHLYGGEIDAVSARTLRDFPSPHMIEQFGRLETNPRTGESGRDQVLKRMNAADCLLLLHGTVPFCEEYIPSKMYEYLWTQRPILALVWRNPQMTRMLRNLGHRAVESNNVDSIALALEDLHAQWVRDDLANSPVHTPYTTAAAARQITTLVRGSLKRHNGLCL
jgi:glycosyltransferase involved in cell wall biosynthesis